jgi:hypothetical protein
MKYADIIIPNGKTNTIAIDFVVNNLKIKIPLKDLGLPQKSSTEEGENLAKAEEKVDD